MESVLLGGGDTGLPCIALRGMSVFDGEGLSLTSCWAVLAFSVYAYVTLLPLQQRMHVTP